MLDASWTADEGIAALRQWGARLITPELIVFPVRHHSPACAWQLKALLARTPVSAVLVEGPHSFTRLIPQLTHPKARMPLAVYGYCVFEAQRHPARPARRYAAYYPFCDHSPELVALQHAAAHDVPARFIDLDVAEQFAVDSATTTEDLSQSLLDEHHLQGSEHLALLARRIGCRDTEELWEHLFEAPVMGRSVEQYLQDLSAYCHLARNGHSHAELQADGTLAREAEMAAAIVEALAQRPAGSGPVLAVVGGFHAVVLPDLVAAGTGRPVIELPPLEDQGSALIRYGQEQLDRLNGYSAGMTSPAWHQALWEGMIKRAKAGLSGGAGLVRTEATLSMLFDVAVELRERHRLAVPLPTLSAAYEQALRLTALRGREAPLREDLLDAVTSCFVKGEMEADGAWVLAVTRRHLCGHAVGQVPPGADRPPLLQDFERRARRQRLKLDEPGDRSLQLDLYRRSDHRQTSRLLHGLMLLGVPLAARVAGPDFVNGLSLGRLWEEWRYRYSPAAEAALIEASVFGTTVPAAVANRFEARVQRLRKGDDPRDARAAAALLVLGCVVGLQDHLSPVLQLLLEVVAEDASVESVAGACSVLGLLSDAREPLEARQLDEVPRLLRSTYQRAMFLAQGQRGAEGDGTGLVDALMLIRELLVSAAGQALDASLFDQTLVTLQHTHDHPLVRGAVAGLRYSAGHLDDPGLEGLLSGHLRGGAAAQAVAFLRGLLSTAREAAWQQAGLLTVLDSRLQDWPEDDFIAVLPELRLAFAAMTPKETDRIAQSVARHHGQEDLGRLVHHDLSAADVQRHLTGSERLKETMRVDGLEGWWCA